MKHTEIRSGRKWTVEIIIKGEPNEIAALVLAAQERQGKDIDVKKLIAETNRAVRKSGKQVLLM